jgi:hypothetical protein
VFKRIKEYQSHPPVLRAPRVGKAFKLYVAAQSRAIGAMLAHEENGKEFTVVYVSRRLGDAKTKYAYVEKLCLSLYYACS